MIDPTTFHTLKVQMVATALALLHILISSLATFLCNIFDHSSILCKLVQIAVNGCAAAVLQSALLSQYGLYLLLKSPVFFCGLQSHNDFLLPYESSP